jgi:VIT1/CCC1 family predicted Fe2+/Mn2+ transporter
MTNLAAQPTLPSDELTVSRSALDPMDRVSEVLFGLIMVLSFTGALSVARAGSAEVHEMLLGALSCNLAWGIIDAAFYLMGQLAEKGHNLLALKAVRATSDPEKAQRLVAGALPSVVAGVLEPAEFAALHQRLRQLPEPPEAAHLDRNDWRGALSVFLLVFLSTLPVVLPFIFMRDIGPAMRVSNAIAVVMLALAGVGFAHITGRNTWMVGIGMVIFGSSLAALTIALGG